MKKIGLLFLTALLSLTLPACNDDDGDYPYVYGLITTVHTLGDKEYYFERDNGQTWKRNIPADLSVRCLPFSSDITSASAFSPIF